MYKYHGFGLNIASEIEFPELLPADFATADITIVWGKTPEKLENSPVVNRPFSSSNKEEYLLDIKNICRYYASYGNNIIAEPAAGIDEHSVRLFLLGTVMAAALYQRGFIPFHASAIVKEGRLVLFAGNSGAGKSTLLAALASRGYTVFTDDICVLQYNSVTNDQVLGTASYPMIKLWEDAIDQLGNDQFNKDFKVRPLLPKYGQFFYDSFNLQSLPVDKVFILSPQQRANEIIVKKLEAIPAFKQMEKQTYKYQFISNTQLRSLHFVLLSQLTSQATVFEVTRPVSGTEVESLLDAVEKIF